jgi:hypothetical protein
LPPQFHVYIRLRYGDRHRQAVRAELNDGRFRAMRVRWPCASEHLLPRSQVPVPLPVRYIVWQQHVLWKLPVIRLQHPDIRIEEGGVEGTRAFPPIDSSPLGSTPI